MVAALGEIVEGHGGVGAHVLAVRVGGAADALKKFGVSEHRLLDHAVGHKRHVLERGRRRSRWGSGS